MNFFKKQYRVLPMLRDNRQVTFLNVEYMPQFKKAFSFKWRNMLVEPYRTESEAWTLIEQMPFLPKPMTYEEYKAQKEQ